jgi:hypothetical protein
MSLKRVVPATPGGPRIAAAVAASLAATTAAATVATTRRRLAGRARVTG